MMMPESRWNDHEGRFEIDRERGFDEESGYGYGYDAAPRRDQGGPAPGPAGRRPHRGSAELRRAVSPGGDIGYGQAPGIGGGYGARGPGDYGRVGGHDFGAATGDYGGGYRGRAPDYGDRRYFEQGRQGRSHGEQRHYGAQGEDRSWVDRARDEVSAWMGDHDAQHRREADEAIHRGRGPKGYRRSDERIRDDVNDRLTDDAWLDASHVEVAVENGDVTLSGTVADRPAKRRAELLAEAVSGVGNVQNNLRVDVARDASREAGLGAAAAIPPIRDPLG
jgi:osmotically-inducible protein OsmY